MKTFIYLKDDGTKWVYHRTDGGQYTYNPHRLGVRCKFCPGQTIKPRRSRERTVASMPDVRDSGE